MPRGETLIVARDENLRAHIVAYLQPLMTNAAFYRFAAPLPYQDALSKEDMHRRKLSKADGIIVALNSINEADREMLELAISTQRPVVIIMKSADPQVWRQMARMRFDSFPPVVAVGAPNHVENFFKDESVSVAIWPPFDLESVALQTVNWIESKIRQQNI